MEKFSSCRAAISQPSPKAASECPGTAWPGKGRDGHPTVQQCSTVQYFDHLWVEVIYEF